jgi:hypothetical protein
VAYRLCGNSLRWVALWARFCRTDTETLVNGYMYDGFTYERGSTWLPPLKRAVVDGHGHLRLEYWAGNEALKGPPIDLQAAAPIPLPGTTTPRIHPDGMEIEAQPEVDSRWRLQVPTGIVMLDAVPPVEQGVVVEGTLKEYTRNSRVVTPGIGFYLEETAEEGTAILLEGFGLTRIGAAQVSTTGAAFTWDDVTGPGCATPAGSYGADPPIPAAAARDDVRDLPGQSAGADVQYRPLPGSAGTDAAAPRAPGSEWHRILRLPAGLADGRLASRSCRRWGGEPCGDTRPSRCRRQPFRKAADDQNGRTMVDTSRTVSSCLNDESRGDQAEEPGGAGHPGA